mmetsp:Transcript_9926/g.11153  ORF Transcript_9926/g.11153 Transcript_9926/m.11153 type:complete len:83 (+) Transcript_9926:3-251(+)
MNNGQKLKNALRSLGIIKRMGTSAVSSIVLDLNGLMEYFQNQCDARRISTEELSRKLLIELLRDTGVKVSYIEATEAFLGFR